MGSDESINALNADLFQPEEVDRFSDPKEARKKAMDYLARREYGRAELVRKLTRAGFVASLSEESVAQLAAEGLQNDTRFVENFVQSRISQGKGPVRIEMDLNQRGLESGIVAAVLEDCDQDWFELAREVRVRKFGGKVPQDFNAKAKQMRFLQYRGFEQAHIQAAVAARGED